MSFCRMGPDSDVYVWGSEDCYSVNLKVKPNSPQPALQQVSSLSRLYDVLTDLALEGYKVPRHVLRHIARLRTAESTPSKL